MTQGWAEGFPDVSIMVMESLAFAVMEDSIAHMQLSLHVDPQQRSSGAVPKAVA